MKVTVVMLPEAEVGPASKSSNPPNSSVWAGASVIHQLKSNISRRRQHRLPLQQDAAQPSQTRRDTAPLPSPHGRQAVSIVVQHCHRADAGCITLMSHARIIK